MVAWSNICATASCNPLSNTPTIIVTKCSEFSGGTVQSKATHFRHIQVSVSSYFEEFQDEQTKMDFVIPRYVLHDFHDQEESKVIQMILNYAHIPYEFKEVDCNDYILEDYPFYSLPMVEIDDKKLGNVPSICRQLAWRYDLTSRTASDDSQVDMVAEKVFAIRLKLKNWLDHIQHIPHHECDELCSEESAVSILCSQLLPVLEGMLRKSKDPWIVGHKMTWADLLTSCLINPILYHLPKLFDKYPLVYLHNQRVAEVPEFEGMLYHVRPRQFDVSGYEKKGSQQSLSIGGSSVRLQ